MLPRLGFRDLLIVLQYRFLKALYPGERYLRANATPVRGLCKLQASFGSRILEAVRGKVVMDFGCGEGWEVLGLAQAGARRVIGVDIRPHLLEQARRNALTAGVSAVCEFTTSPSGKVDLIVTLDTFEHFAEPAAVLFKMNDLLASGGEVWVHFGPPWLHPLGGHLFSVFPWAYLILSEAALIRWRSEFRSDGAQRFEEVEGGLNRMTIGRFLCIVEASPFKLADLELVPIRKLRWLYCALTREFLTAAVRCRLVPR